MTQYDPKNPAHVLGETAYEATIDALAKHAQLDIPQLPSKWDKFAAQEVAKAVREAAQEELALLHSLPVLTSCGACGWRMADHCLNAPVAASEMPRTVDPNAPPPAWCPLRGAT